MHRDGGYTEYVTLEPGHLHRIPEDIPFEHAAIEHDEH